MIKKCRIFAVFSFLLCLHTFAGPAVLFEEVDIAAKKKSGRDIIQPLSSRKSIREELKKQDFDDAMELRTRRRAGVGLTAYGQVGMAGAVIELNFAPADSFLGQFGGGNRYNALALEWKHVFGGIAFAPYATVGYSRWHSSNASKGPISSSNPSILVNKYLTDEEKSSGQFSKDFLIPSLGFQYYQLFGEYIGSSVYVEVVFLMELNNPSPVPTGATGYIYYF